MQMCHITRCYENGHQRCCHCRESFQPYTSIIKSVKLLTGQYTSNCKQGHFWLFLAWIFDTLKFVQLSKSQEKSFKNLWHQHNVKSIERVGSWGWGLRGRVLCVQVAKKTKKRKERKAGVFQARWGIHDGYSFYIPVWLPRSRYPALLWVCVKLNNAQLPLVTSSCLYHM